MPFWKATLGEERPVAFSLSFVLKGDRDLAYFFYFLSASDWWPWTWLAHFGPSMQRPFGNCTLQKLWESKFSKRSTWWHRKIRGNIANTIISSFESGQWRHMGWERKWEAQPLKMHITFCPKKEESLGLTISLSLRSNDWAGFGLALQLEIDPP